MQLKIEMIIKKECGLNQTEQMNEQESEISNVKSFVVERNLYWFNKQEKPTQKIQLH